MTKLYSRAMQFAVAGMSVMPIGKDKRPLLTSWKKYQTTAATEEEIETWWNKWPEANIGIITGKVSGMSVIDVDTYHGGSIEPFPDTFTVRTGNGGYHLYYKYHPGLSISAGAYSQFPGVDIRSDGGYVVGPFSTTDYVDKGVRKGGSYEIVNDIPYAAFPATLFPIKKESRALSTKIGVTTGGRNDSIASFIGQLLHASKEDVWLTEVWDAVQTANETYKPPLSLKELKATFNSILTKETERRSSLIISPMQIGDGVEMQINIRKNGNGVSYKDMANVLMVLSQHPEYSNRIRYNEFKRDIEWNGTPIEDDDLRNIQYFMQTTANLHGISKSAVEDAVYRYAYQNKYDEAKDWLNSLVWDNTPRLPNWIHQATGVEDDDYHAGVGAQWFMGLMRRLMEPGTTFDHVLLLVGGQGIGKTSFFRILGGEWYKSYTGAMDNKDFYLALRGAMILDLDEGAALYRSEAIKIKSIITETHDEYREPYGRVMKKYPRRFVFSMSTNDTEPFRDMTGNRRYWAVDLHQQVNFQWLTDNRDQLFAEAFHAWKNKIPVPEVPLQKALESQEMHLPQDSWTDLVMDVIQKRSDYCCGDTEYFTTIAEIYSQAFPEEPMARFGKPQEMRIGQILKTAAGLEKRRIMIDGERKMRWMFTDKRAKELQEKQATNTSDEFDL